MGVFQVYADMKRNTLNVDYPSEGWFVDNTQCGSDVTLTDVRGIGFTVKAGNLYALNYTPATTMFAQSTAVVANSGPCTITSSEAGLDTSNNNPQALVSTVSGTITTNPGPNPQPVTGTVDITGQTINIEGQTVNIGTMPPVSGTVGMAPGSTIGLTPGNTVGLIPGTGINVNNDVTDPLARSYLAALQGLLPQSLHTLNFAGNVGAGPNAEQTFVIINATTQIAIAVAPVVSSSFARDGVLWLWYSFAGIRSYLINKTYWNPLYLNYENQFVMPWETYTEYMPAGSTVGVGYEGQGTVYVRV